ncbi:MAG: hypothetical protein IJQ85_03835 [Selenomonadaceae bacterium]|nr:hypothetical protein [Selenomonadaceae bacterium]
MAWTAGTNPNAVLVNEMLVQAVSKLKDDEHPIVHTDRGCQVARPDRTYGEELVDSVNVCEELLAGQFCLRGFLRSLEK